MLAQSGATRGSYRKLALAAMSLAAAGFAFALLATAVEVSKGLAPLHGDDLGIARDSSAYRLFLAVDLLFLLPVATATAVAAASDKILRACMHPLAWAGSCRAVQKQLGREHPSAAACVKH